MPTFAPRQEATAELGIPLRNLMVPSPIPIPMSNGVQAQALHVNGLTPHTYQHYTYIMTCNSCARVHDIKEIIKDILHFVSDHPGTSYDSIQFTEVNIAGGEWRNLLIRLRIDSPSHCRLHGVMLHQPDSFISTA